MNEFNDGCSKMHDEPSRIAALQRIAALCQEAVTQHSDDWPALERFIHAKMRELPDAERRTCEEAIERILRFRGPDGPALQDH